MQRRMTLSQKDERLASYWMLLSCQQHRVSSGRKKNALLSVNVRFRAASTQRVAHIDSKFELASCPLELRVHLELRCLKQTNKRNFRLRRRHRAEGAPPPLEKKVWEANIEIEALQGIEKETKRQKKKEHEAMGGKTRE